MGGCGGKHEPIGCDCGALLLSQKTGNLAKIVYSQEEVFLSACPLVPYCPQCFATRGRRGNGRRVASPSGEAGGDERQKNHSAFGGEKFP